MSERPIAVRGKGATNCIYGETCKGREICGRRKPDIVIAEIPVDGNVDSLSGAISDLRTKMSEWGNIAEERCTREDNSLDGNPVIVFRSVIYWIEHIYEP